MQEKISKTVENYIKSIYEGTENSGFGIFPLSQLAKRLDVTPGTVTVMVKRIEEDGLLEYFPRKGCKLTPLGISCGRTIVRKHRLIEFFLVNTLGMDWSEVHAEAEMLEHALSDSVLARLDEFLGYPEFDPHGKHIPKCSGEPFIVEKGSFLDSCVSGREYVILSVDDENGGLLRTLGAAGVVPGKVIKILDNNSGSGTITFSSMENKEVTLGLQTARSIIVK